MDPKSIANLDPKLRETYERVMGNSSGGAAAPAPAAAVTPADPFSTGGPATPVSTPAAPAPSQFDNNTPVSPPADAGLSTPVTPEAQLSPVVPNNPAASMTNASAAVFNSSTSGIPSNSGPASQSDLTGGTGLQPLASPASAAQTTQGSNSLVKVLYIFGGVIFFIVYIFFWIKIFNYQLPF